MYITHVFGHYVNVDEHETVARFPTDDVNWKEWDHDTAVTKEGAPHYYDTHMSIRYRKKHDL